MVDRIRGGERLEGGRNSFKGHRCPVSHIDPFFFRQGQEQEQEKEQDNHHPIMSANTSSLSKLSTVHCMAYNSGHAPPAIRPQPHACSTEQLHHCRVALLQHCTAALQRGAATAWRGCSTGAWRGCSTAAWRGCSSLSLTVPPSSLLSLQSALC